MCTHFFPHWITSHISIRGNVTKAVCMSVLLCVRVCETYLVHYLNVVYHNYVVYHQPESRNGVHSRTKPPQA